MASIMEFVDAWERERSKSQAGTIDGHIVSQIVWETPRVIVFRDASGKVWRRVHSWGMTWPVALEICRADQQDRELTK
jgi:hypothetical protein